MELDSNDIVLEFKTRFEKSPQLVVRSPGRINLLGEHTDYNNGYVLPASIDREIYFAFSVRDDDNCAIYSLNLDESAVFPLESVEKGKQNWSNYLKGIILEISSLGYKLKGFNLVFGGNIPIGAGVSSSAALETGIAFGLNELFNLEISKLAMVQLCQRSENEFVGLQCGIMDMFASMMGKKNHVIQLDCRSLAYDYYPFTQDEYTIILCDTGVKHNLGSSEYNTRRLECEEGLKVLQNHFSHLRSLRDVSKEMLVSAESYFEPLIFKRCLYVVKENERVISGCNDLMNNNLIHFGQKMFETHLGLKNEYEVSCEELDFLVTRSQDFNQDGGQLVLGSRMMGGGFGGCTINLVKKNICEAYISQLEREYNLKFNKKLKCYHVGISDGTSLLKPSNN